MASLRTFWSHHRRLAVVLMVLTLAVRAIVPSGYMVASSPKSITVYVCAQASGMAKMVTILIDADLPTNGHDSDKQSDCAFVGMAAAVDLPAAVDAELGVIAGHFVPRIHFNPAPGRGLAAPPPFATGPPTLI
jgi:hypothetical protein